MLLNFYQLLTFNAVNLEKLLTVTVMFNAIKFWFNDAKLCQRQLLQASSQELKEK
jgi:hypothetical protein